MSFSKYLAIAAVAGLVAAAIPVHASTQTPAPRVTAAGSLESRIEATIDKDTELALLDIDADVEDGVVTLKGTVHTAEQKARAERVAMIEGVTRVQNELKIDPTAARMTRAERVAAKTKAGTGKAIDESAKAADKTKEVAKDVAGKTADVAKDVAGKTKEIVGAGKETGKDVGKDVGEKAKEAAGTTGEMATDAVITTKVKAKFVDETILKDSDISVDTDDHVVTLKGTVRSAAAKARAEEIARKTDGVKRVVNDLVVKPQ